MPIIRIFPENRVASQSHIEANGVLATGTTAGLIQLVGATTIT